MEDTQTGGSSHPLQRVDLLAHPSLLQIFFEADPSALSCNHDVDVVFLFDGRVSSDHTARVVASVGIPQKTVFPKAGKHDFLFGENGVLLAISIDSKKGPTLSNMRSWGGMITRALLNEICGIQIVRIHVEESFCTVSGNPIGIIRALIHGLQTPTYSFDDLKSKKPEPRTLHSVYLNCGNLAVPLAELNDARDSVNNLVVAEHLSRKWVDLPAQAGCMNTVDLVNLARRIAKENEDVVSFVAIEGEELNRQGLGALWNVGKGRTDSPPALVVLSYCGGGEKVPFVALVGKGLVFDTGGENIKTYDMPEMKADMAGAAMVLATFWLAVQEKARVNLVVALAIADNSVSGQSYHPSNVLTSYNGRTIEVSDTDAEGRLALVDAVGYVEEHFHPDFLITVATLTGACVVALGNEFAGLFARTPEIADIVMDASQVTWNKVWPLPLIDAEKTKLNPSTVADVSNMGPRYGGAITAAKFIIEEFAKTVDAAHLDVAGVAMKDGFDATGEKAPFSTGFGPALLQEAVRILSENDSM